MSAENSTSAEPEYKIDLLGGCPTCHGDYAITGKDIPKSMEDEPPVCSSCGEVLSSESVTPLD